MSCKLCFFQRNKWFISLSELKQWRVWTTQSLAQNTAVFLEANGVVFLFFFSEINQISSWVSNLVQLNDKLSVTKPVSHTKMPYFNTHTLFSLEHKHARHTLSLKLSWFCRCAMEMSLMLKIFDFTDVLYMYNPKTLTHSGKNVGNCTVHMFPWLSDILG